MTRENSHVDHYNLNFADLVNKWIDINGIENISKYLNKTIDNVLESTFNDQSITKNFIDFHNENTNLRLVSIKANLSILKLKK